MSNAIHLERLNGLTGCGRMAWEVEHTDRGSGEPATCKTCLRSRHKPVSDVEWDFCGGMPVTEIAKARGMTVAQVEAFIREAMR